MGIDLILTFTSSCLQRQAFGEFSLDGSAPLTTPPTKHTAPGTGPRPSAATWGQHAPVNGAKSNTSSSETKCHDSAGP